MAATEFASQCSFSTIFVIANLHWSSIDTSSIPIQQVRTIGQIRYLLVLETGNTICFGCLRRTFCGSTSVIDKRGTSPDNCLHLELSFPVMTSMTISGASSNPQHISASSRLMFMEHRLPESGILRMALVCAWLTRLVGTWLSCGNGSSTSNSGALLPELNGIAK